MDSSIPVFRASPEAEVVRGVQFYRDTLRDIHARLQPDVYLEIGVRHGFSLALSAARISIGVDPAPELRAELGAHVRIATATSDAFFERTSDALTAPIDLAFIDGMHWFEYALRDFINVEQRASANGVVVFDDVLPNHPLQAERERKSGVWTGDVWKILPCLRRHRPDLNLTLLDTNPTGLLLVTNPDPGNTSLRENYAAIVAEFTRADAPGPGPDVLAREGAENPATSAVFALLEQRRRRCDVTR